MDLIGKEGVNLSNRDAILGGKIDLGKIKLHDFYLAPRPSQVEATRALAGRGLPFKWHSHGTWLFILALFLVIGIFGLAVFIYLYWERRARAHEQRARELELVARQQERTLLQRAREELIVSFPTRYLDIESVHDVACPICLIEYTDGDHVMTLPLCNHMFCVSCIRTFWSTSTLLTCPFCRMDYTTWRPERAVLDLV